MANVVYVIILVLPSTMDPVDQKLAFLAIFGEKQRDMPKTS